ncbi:PorP/SprF family type IX secretion system membrane protein [Fulvivirga lutimaris]|uniref:PorP/SprF family type IX secretion system membrane protein n=1 Tax=Fulvivirga lutimaris TaxID=1819566 RepID=UPI001628B497|nr:PorP/SprF family type IX secretion system membrane protein [Fulvivirga lutimaris]
MKKLFTAFLFIYTTSVFGQDLPLFTQSFTNTFIYNPSFSGIDYGSFTLAHNRSWINTEGAPTSNFLSINTPIPETNLGIGFSLLSEQINFYENLYLSGAVAYHIPLNGDQAFSFGLSGEYSNIRINRDQLVAQDLTEDVLVNLGENVNNLDLSVGVSFRSTYYLAGVSANRLASSFTANETGVNFSQFYNAYLRLMLPMRGGKDVLEPVINYRNLAASGSQLSAGLFYTYNELIMIGSSFRQTNVWSHSIGLSINNRLALGYTYETVNQGILSSNNPTHEIVLRYDLLRTGYKYKNASYIQQAKMALAIRRKTLTKRTVTGSRAQLSKHKIKSLNPNKRYNQPKRKKYKSKRLRKNRGLQKKRKFKRRRNYR